MFSQYPASFLIFLHPEQIGKSPRNSLTCSSAACNWAVSARSFSNRPRSRATSIAKTANATQRIKAFHSAYQKWVSAGIVDDQPDQRASDCQWGSKGGLSNPGAQGNRDEIKDKKADLVSSNLIQKRDDGRKKQTASKQKAFSGRSHLKFLS